MLKAIAVLSFLFIALLGCEQKVDVIDEGLVKARRSDATDVKVGQTKEITKKASKSNNSPVVLAAFSEYEQLSIQGWVVMVSPRVRGDAKQYSSITKQLDKDLLRLKSVVPESALVQLQTTKIWLEQGMPLKKLNATFFNGGRKLTKKHGLVPESYGGIIIGNTKGYLAVAGFKKWQMLHELTHAYHQFYIKHNFAPVVDAYNYTMKHGLHNPALDTRVKGSGYPTRNKKEYLSELTVAYFGKKFAYPHDRSELAHYDPQGYCAVVKTWGLLGKQTGDVPLRCN